MSATQIDSFMASIRTIESGGRYTVLGPQTRYGRPRGAYQILDSNWAAWAKEAGIAGADWRDPRAQDRVARYKMLQYYRAYGSWDAVAVAWFAGPGRAKKWAAGDYSVGQMKDVLGTSVAGYVKKMRDNMGTAPSRSGPAMTADGYARQAQRQAQRQATQPGYIPLTARRQHFTDIELLLAAAKAAAGLSARQSQVAQEQPHPDARTVDPAAGPYAAPAAQVYDTFLNAFENMYKTGAQHELPDEPPADTPETASDEQIMLAMLESYSTAMAGGYTAPAAPAAPAAASAPSSSSAPVRTTKPPAKTVHNPSNFA